MMAPRRRLEDATCAICMGELFENRDELDEVMPIATADCGHVYHEQCLQSWFKSQENQWLAQALEFDLRNENGDPVTAADAPVLCPSCRTECMADPDTGKPMIYRLYIDFGGNEAGPPSSSHMPSSSPMIARRKEKSVGGDDASGRDADREVFGFARVARGMLNEVEALGPESQEDEVVGVINRARTLSTNMASAKAMEGFKKFVVGLADSLDHLSETLKNSPLISVLNERLKQAQDHSTFLSKELDREQKSTSKLKRDALTLTKDLKQAEMNLETVTRQYEREKVQRTSGKKAAEERYREYQNRIAGLEQKLNAEKMDNDELRDTLRERNKQLKVAKASMESRKVLHAEIERLKAENERLRQANLSGINQAGRLDVVPGGADESVEEIAQNSSLLPTRPQFSRSQAVNKGLQVSRKRAILSDDDDDEQEEGGEENGMKKRKDKAMDSEIDDSLEIDMPSHSEPSERSTVKSATARTYTFDQNIGLIKTKPDVSRSSVSTNNCNPPKRSKFFDSSLNNKSGSLTGRSILSSVSAVMGSDPKRQEQVNRLGNTARISVQPPLVAETPPSMSKTNPFLTTREEGARKRQLPPVSGLQQSQSHRERRVISPSPISDTSSSDPLAPSSPPPPMPTRLTSNQRFIGMNNSARDNTSSRNNINNKPTVFVERPSQGSNSSSRTNKVIQTKHNKNLAQRPSKKDDIIDMTSPTPSPEVRHTSRYRKRDEFIPEILLEPRVRKRVNYVEDEDVMDDDRKEAMRESELEAEGW